jgi:hypothetical protein
VKAVAWRDRFTSTIGRSFSSLALSGLIHRHAMPLPWRITIAEKPSPRTPPANKVSLLPALSAPAFDFCSAGGS